VASQPKVETIFLPFSADAEGDVPFESPEQVFDLHALSDAHDGVEMIRHGQGDQRRPATLFLNPRRRFEDNAPAAGIIEVMRAAKLVAQCDECRLGFAGPRGALVWGCLA
jgi:hypothetical protein